MKTHHDESPQSPIAGLGCCNTARPEPLRSRIRRKVMDLERITDQQRQLIHDLSLLDDMLPNSLTDAQEAAVKRLIEPALTSL